MKDYIRHDEWCIIEEGFNPKHNRVSESLFSIGNGRMGQRANFEEHYSGDSLQGSYVAGVYYPDKTRVGWWKNGYPEYFAKVLNAANWIGIYIEVDGEVLDLATAEVRDFTRILNMREGYLERSFKAKLRSGKEVAIHSKRICSIVSDEIGAIRYSITPLNFDGRILIQPYVDYDVSNQDSNYGEKFWEEVSRHCESRKAYITARTRKTDFHVCTGMKFTIVQNGVKAYFEAKPLERDKYVANAVSVLGTKGKETVIYKYAAVVSDLNHERATLMERCAETVAAAYQKGFDQLVAEQAEAWATKWSESDIKIEGDVAAQQGIRFNIFQLNQTYTGEDERLNIGPKGFTGEKYGGSTYWDTEAYCLPFYLATADSDVARNLLRYRYKQLGKAIENAQKLGFKNGAALYPMVTMNGEECHNEWEITFEEIHRNGAIAYAIYDYINYTGDKDYLVDYGLEVLVAIARFWSQRVNFSEAKQQYVMLGVTGPNEYENNVNNNWYTNFIASWCMQYAQEALDYVRGKDAAKLSSLLERIQFDEAAETARWKDIVARMHYPADESKGIFLQQEGFLDKEIIPVADLPKSERPLNQKWSWDRILRSCYIKQADTLQGLYFFEDQFDLDTHRRNFDFYEPLTVHESSLSPCVHVILASKLGYQDKAYELYLRTARLDLDDYNNDTEDGCHTTSMAGTWMAVIKGFAGMRVRDGKLHFAPFIPSQWQAFSFKIRFRGQVLDVRVKQDGIEIENESSKAIEVVISGQAFTIEAGKSVTK
jgi:maltose phosphorylase